MVFSYKDGWLQDPENFWIVRFHRDMSSWSRYPFVFIDLGRIIDDQSPPLLKSRKYIDRRDAIELWKKLLDDGWNLVPPKWG